MKNVTKKYRKHLTMSILFVLIAGFAGTFVQFLKGELLDSAIAGEGGSALIFALLFLVTVLAEIAAYYGYERFRGRFVIGCIKTMRESYFTRLLRRSPVEIMARQQGEFVAEYTDKINQISNNYHENIPMLVEIISKAAIVSVSLFLLDYRVALVTLFLLTMPLYVPKLVEKRLQKAKKESVESFQKHLGRVVEWLSGFELIKNYSIESVIRNKFLESNDDVADRLFRFKNMTYISGTITALLSYLSHFIIIAVAALLVFNNEFSAGEFFIAVGLIDQLSYPIIVISAYLQEYLSVKPMVREMDALFSETQDDVRRTEQINEVESIEFKNVVFSYDGAERILNGFSVKVSAGEKCLITGQSGAGKSTSMNLLMGYYEPQKGDIRLNGIDVGRVAGLNEKIAIMRQDPVLFNDTLRNNLTMYRDIEDSEIIDMLLRLNLDKFAAPEALDGMILEGGSNLSGGERKRIALARTLLRHAPVTIIDEPLANVDADAAAKIEDILTEPTDGIVFVITHQFAEEKRGAFSKQVTV